MRAATGVAAAGVLLAGCGRVPTGESVENAAAAGDRGATTDLPDGAVVTYQMTHAAAGELPRGEWPARNLIADGTAVVQGGVYWARLNTTYWPPGRVDVRVQFPVAPQPDAVQRRYGPFGEHLTGDNVSDVGGARVVTAEHAFDWTR